MQVPKGKIGKPVKSGCGPAAVTLPFSKKEKGTLLANKKSHCPEDSGWEGSQKGGGVRRPACVNVHRVKFCAGSPRELEDR